MIANFYAPEEIINVNNCIYVLLKILGQTMALTNSINLDMSDEWHRKMCEN